jgi:hypothetical protein
MMKMETMPGGMKIVAENTRAAVAWRGRCRNSGYDHDAGDEALKREALQPISINHGMTNSGNST